MVGNENATNDINKIDIDGKRSIRIIGFAFIFLCAIYIIWFGLVLKLPFTDDPASLGSFGDYIGGILNPCIALFACYWLISSIKTQVKELTDSRKQFENISNQQQKQIAIQNFESLFFQLLEAKNDVTNTILVNRFDEIKNLLEKKNKIITHNLEIILNKNHNSSIEVVEAEEFKKLYEQILADKQEMIGKESIKNHIIVFKSFSLPNWEEFYTKILLDYMGSYFRLCYQIIKLIDSNEILKAKDAEDENKEGIPSKLQKKYFDIFRATLTQHELEAFFFNCLSSYGNQKFKTLIEKYGLFEPLLIDTNKKYEELHRLTRYAYLYEEQIFENNLDFKVYFKEVDKLKGINKLDIMHSIFTLLMLNIISTVSKSFEVSHLDVRKSFENFKEVFDTLVFGYNFDRIVNNFIEDKNKYLEIIINGYSENVMKDKNYLDDTENKLSKISEIDIALRDRYLNEITELQHKIANSTYKIYLINNLKYLDEINIILKYKINISEFLKNFK